LWDETRWNEQREAWIESESGQTDLAAELSSISL
jgi:hypothetical protein